jgi:type IV pilus assembly protein PilW
MNTVALVEPRGRHGGAAGFSLVELLVALLITSAAVLLVMQVFSLSEKSKRTTSGGNEATVTGAIAATRIQSDIRQSGLGMVASSTLACNLTLPSGQILSPLLPVAINHAGIAAGDADSDTLLVMVGNPNGSPEGDPILSQPSASTLEVTTPSAFRVNEYLVLAAANRPSTCDLTLYRVSAASGANPITLSTTMPVPLGLADTAVSLGTNPRLIAYRVQSGQLLQCDLLSADCSDTDSGAWAVYAEGVVALRAQYGRDTSATPDGVVDVWDQTQPTNAATANAVRSVRFVIVIRSGEFEKTVVTLAPPTWAGSGTSIKPEQAITLSGLGNDWDRYRYKTFEAVAPLRNRM